MRLTINSRSDTNNNNKKNNYSSTYFFQSCLLLCPNQQQQSVFLYTYYFLYTVSRGDKTTFVLFDIFKTISLYIRWADICFVFFCFFCRALLLFSFVFRGRQTRVSWPPIGWWGPCVLRCWENPNTHRQAGLSLFYLFFSLSVSYIFFLFFLFRYTTNTHSSHILFPLLLFPFSMCVCWLAGCLVYPTAAQRQANEKRRTVMDARP